MSESVLAQRTANRVGRAPRGEREILLELAQGQKDLIKLGRGDPDLDTPGVIIDAAVHALRNGYTHYTHWAGMLELRQAIAEKLKRDNGLDYDPASEIVVTTGGQEAMNVIFQGLINEGDEVLIADPYYTAYKSVVDLAGGVVKTIPTVEKDNFALQPESIEQAITEKTKVLIVVSPNNPTGAVIPKETLQRIAEVAVSNDLLVVSDEIYERIVFDDVQHVSIASFPGMRERTIVLNGFSKAYSMTGWRIGYFAAPSDFVDQVQMVKYNLTISVNHATQAAALAALSPEGQRTIEETRAIYSERRRVMMDALDAMGLSYSYPGGAMYVFVNIQSTGKTSFEFCRDLLQDAGVQIFPGTTYGTEGYVRISFLAPVERLRVAMDRMNEAVKRYLAEAKG
jgi:aminotransferase